MAESQAQDRPKLMRRIFPHPLLTVLLIVVWCVITNSVAPGTIVLGVILGILIPFFTYPYWPHVPRGFR